MMDETVSGLRAQFNSLAGVTSSAEVHQQLVPKISELQSQINVLTEEVSKLRAIVQAAAAATASAGVNDDMKVSAAAALAQTGAPTLRSFEFEGSAAAAALAQTAASTLRSSEPKGSPAAAKGQNVDPTGSIAGSTDSKDSKVRGGGGSSL